MRRYAGRERTSVCRAREGGAERVRESRRGKRRSEDAARSRPPKRVAVHETGRERGEGDVAGGWRVSQDGETVVVLRLGGMR